MEKFLGFKEIRTVKFAKAVLCEFLATCILIVVGCGACVSMDSGKPLPVLTPALVFGMTVAYLVWTFNHVSGAHMNPAVTVSFLVTGHVSLVKTIAYTIAQCAGAIAGAAIVWLMVPPSWRGTIGSTVFSEEITLAQGFAVEVMCSFILMLGVFATSDQYRTDHAGSMPLTMGLLVFMESAWAGNLTGCSMNPARTLGPALISGTWDHHWVYWIAPFVGAVPGSLLYQYALAEVPQPMDRSIHIEPAADLPQKVSDEERITEKPIIMETIPTISTDSLTEGFDNMAFCVNKS